MSKKGKKAAATEDADNEDAEAKPPSRKRAANE